MSSLSKLIKLKAKKYFAKSKKKTKSKEKKDRFIEKKDERIFDRHERYERYADGHSWGHDRRDDRPNWDIEFERRKTRKEKSMDRKSRRRRMREPEEEIPF